MSAEAVTTRAAPDADRGIPADKRKRYELLQDCREIVVSKLCKVVREALVRMSDELTETALKATRREEQQALMDAIAIVRQNRDEIETRFRKAFADCFERRLFSKPDDRQAAAGFDGELALVDDAVISDQLTVDRIVHRTRGKLDPDEVLGIRARLGALLDREWFDENAHPASPEAVFEALKSALNELSPKQEVQTALLDAFEPHVASNLNVVYSSVNERLKANRILPKIRPQVAVQPSARKSRPGEPEGAARDGAEAAAMRGVPGAGVGVGTGMGMGMGMGAAPGVGLGDYPGAELAAAFDATMQQLAQGVPSARLSAARLLTDPDTFGVADLPMPVAQPPLLDALSTIQASSASAPIVGSQIVAQLTAQARDTGSPLDQLTVEIVSLVFDYIYADRRLADVIKQQLLRLQVVAVKAALIDRSFFARRQHPMRRLIDRISDLASDPDADVAADSPLVKGLTATVEWILENFDRDLATFEQALEGIEKLAQDEAARRAERLAQLTREAERTEALAIARETARAQVAERVDEATPAFVREFLDAWWTRAMAESSLVEETGPQRMAEALQVAEQLIWSVSPKTAEEIARLAGLLPRLIGGLMRGVRSVQMPDAEREAFFNELLRVHTRGIEAAKQAQAAKSMAPRATARIRMRADGSIQFTPARSEDGRKAAEPSEPPMTPADRALRTADVSRGDQIEIDGDEGEPQRYKLAWISPSQKLFILSRYPDEARSFERTEFALLFDTGRARVVERRSTLERAIDHLTADTRTSKLA